ncbi:MAG: response regulator transcription factor [Candidatus Brevundimonas colombiensis]|uniref:Response regulator transcription factor n=1 Tax=Candidatus Brevundimonas colombiensis TaxID=3121376 RepID=A0AAJ5WZ71_9CAUL|nr:response regulator transcription factor [Brevundimonas sp.]WEK41066.1 MAG: response regulator transcription factor [Brevundimonas sp.]
MDRIVVADDHPLFRAALRSAVDKAAPGAEVIECASLAEARAALQAGPVDLLLLDLKLSDSEGMAGLAALRAEHPAAPVGVVSASEDAPVVRNALGLGAAGFIPKSTALPQMVEAIAAILAGDGWAPDVPEAEDDDLAERVASLTPSQLRILEGLKAGRLNKQIAFDLGVSEATIKAHLTSVFRKLGVQNRTQAVILAKQMDPG